MIGGRGELFKKRKHELVGMFTKVSVLITFETSTGVHCGKLAAGTYTYTNRVYLSFILNFICLIPTFIFVKIFKVLKDIEISGFGIPSYCN